MSILFLIGWVLVLKGIFRVPKLNNSDSSIRMKDAMTVKNSSDQIIATYCNYSDCILRESFLYDSEWMSFVATRKFRCEWLQLIGCLTFGNRPWTFSFIILSYYRLSVLGVVFNQLSGLVSWLACLKLTSRVAGVVVRLLLGRVGFCNNNISAYIS